MTTSKMKQCGTIFETDASAFVIRPTNVQKRSCEMDSRKTPWPWIETGEKPQVLSELNSRVVVSYDIDSSSFNADR
jgi:hypothetical protein